MYLAGRGVAANRQDGELWLKRAAAQRYGKARDLLAKLSKTPAAAAPSKGWGANIVGDQQKGQSNANVTVVPLKLANGRSALLEAALRGQSKIVQELIGKGADLETRDEDGNTALALAAVTGSAPVIELLLSRGANIDARNKLKETPLILAAAKGHVAAAAMLIAGGADVNVKSEKNDTPLMLAVRQCEKQLVPALLAKGADPDFAPDRMPPLTLASISCDGAMLPAWSSLLRLHYAHPILR